MFIGATFNLIVIILSEIGSHIITDFTTSSLTITTTPLLHFLLLRKILCICLRPHFLAALLETMPLHPSMFLPLPLYLFSFFSFHLRRLRAYLIRISFLHSMWLFCYSNVADRKSTRLNSSH